MESPILLEPITINLQNNYSFWIHQPITSSITALNLEKAFACNAQKAIAMLMDSASSTVEFYANPLNFENDIKIIIFYKSQHIKSY